MKQEFANEMAFLSLGATAGCVMTDCEKYGMCYGCDEYCPVLIAGKCEISPKNITFKKSTKSFER